MQYSETVFLTVAMTESCLKSHGNSEGILQHLQRMKFVASASETTSGENTFFKLAKNKS